VATIKPTGKVPVAVPVGPDVHPGKTVWDTPTDKVWDDFFLGDAMGI